MALRCFVAVPVLLTALAASPSSGGDATGVPGPTSRPAAPAGVPTTQHAPAFAIPGGFIDAHVHFHDRKPGDLDVVAAWMETVM